MGAFFFGQLAVLFMVAIFAAIMAIRTPMAIRIGTAGMLVLGAFALQIFWSQLNDGATTCWFLTLLAAAFMLTFYSCGRRDTLTREIVGDESTSTRLATLLVWPLGAFLVAFCQFVIAY